MDCKELDKENCWTKRIAKRIPWDCKELDMTKQLSLSLFSTKEEAISLPGSWRQAAFMEKEISEQNG